MSHEQSESESDSSDEDTAEPRSAQSEIDDTDPTYVTPFQENDLPSFHIDIETEVVVGQDSGDQYVMWRAEGSSGTEVVSSTPMDAAMQVIEDETGGVI